MFKDNLVSLILGIAVLIATTSLISTHLTKAHERKMQILRQELSKEETKRWELFINATRNQKIPSGSPTEMVLD